MRLNLFFSIHWLTRSLLFLSLCFCSIKKQFCFKYGIKCIYMMCFFCAFSRVDIDLVGEEKKVNPIWKRERKKVSPLLFWIWLLFIYMRSMVLAAVSGLFFFSSSLETSIHMFYANILCMLFFGCCCTQCCCCCWCIELFGSHINKRGTKMKKKL